MENTILGMKPMTAALVGGGLLVAALAYYSMQARKNPVLYTRVEPNRRNRKAHMKPTRFVKASKLKK